MGRDPPAAGASPRWGPLCTMRNIDGVEPPRLTADRAAPLRLLDPVFARACDAIAGAHRRGVVHRGLEPGSRPKRYCPAGAMRSAVQTTSRPSARMMPSPVSE